MAMTSMLPVDHDDSDSVDDVDPDPDDACGRSRL